MGDTANAALIDENAAPDQPEPLAAIVDAGRADRLGNLDFIRGIAVMGILAANIVAFGQPWAAYMYPGAFTVPHSAAEDWMWVAQFVLVDGKMRGLFTLLFGAGMMLFLDKAWERGGTRWLQARRLLWLGLFGLAHFFLIWRGDILFTYALGGLVALLFARMSGHKLMIVGLMGYVLGAAAYLAMLGPLPGIAEGAPGDSASSSEAAKKLEAQKNEDLEEGRFETRMIQTGSYAEIVEHSVRRHAGDIAFMVPFFLLETVPLILIGMGLYRVGLYTGRWDAARQRRWGWTGLLIGSALTLWAGLWAKAGGFTFYGTLAAFMAWTPVPRLVAVIGLAALLALWGASASGWLAVRVRAAGRAAFTNYLGTSVVMMLVFHGWAGGQFGRLGRAELYLVVLAAWVLMLLWSKPWLERFRYGPLEWLWRCLTYWRLFPLRR